jgi:hypothetical protein
VHYILCVIVNICATIQILNLYIYIISVLNMEVFETLSSCLWFVAVCLTYVTSKFALEKMYK